MSKCKIFAMALKGLLASYKKCKFLDKSSRGFQKKSRGILRRRKNEVMASCIVT